MSTKQSIAGGRFSALIGMGIAALAPCAAAGGGGGTLLWHVEFATPQAGTHTAVADDGTVYASDNLNLYAVNPDGTEQWLLNGFGGGRPIDIAGDGTIYTGGGDDVFAVNPDGSPRWSFPLPNILVAGPSLGPDGNLYGSTDNSANDPEDGQGAFSIDPDPENPTLRWTDIGDPSIFSLTGSNLPVVFADGRAVMGITTTAAGGAPIWAFDFDGDQDWFGSDLQPLVFGKPEVDTAGRVITSAGQSIVATDPDGSNAWQSQVPQGVSGLLPPVSDGNGVIYTADTIGGERWALHPDGTTKYFASGGSGVVNTIGVSPDGSTLLLGGNTFGDPGFVRGYDADDGSLLWEVTLDPQGGFNEFVYSLGFSFSPDNSTAYFTTRVGGNQGDGRLYAVRLSLTGDVNDDGAVGSSDLNLVLADFGCADGGCPGDADGDGDTDSADLNIVLAAFGSG